MKIEVFLRQCFLSPNASLPNRHRPKWFDKVEIFRNLKSTIDPKVANLNIVYDEHFGPIGDTFLKDEENVEIINCGNEAGSFLATLDIIESRNYDDDTIIYFLEDDYLHKEGWCDVLLEAFSIPIQYVSLYDHLDKYIDAGYNGLVSRIFVTKTCHWRTTPSTCNTYASRMGQLREDMWYHRHFSAAAPDGVSMDHAKFTALGDRRKLLITSIPGYSTHVDHLQSPTVDWEFVQLKT